MLTEIFKALFLTSCMGALLTLVLALFKPELDAWEPGQHTGTFRGNQLSLVAGKAGLEIFIDTNLGSEVQRKGEIVSKFLTEEIEVIDSRIQHRGIGLIWGLDFSAFPETTTKALISACFRNGLIIERVGRENKVLKIMPPLIIEDALLVKGLEILKKAVKEIL